MPGDRHSSESASDLIAGHASPAPEPYLAAAPDPTGVGR
jgi:hypothetical protein